MSRQAFVITVTGEMVPTLLEEFEDVETTVARGVTRLRIAGPDPSMLHGVLHRIDALGCEVLDVQHVEVGRSRGG
jgi:hypothetical protein